MEKITNKISTKNQKGLYTCILHVIYMRKKLKIDVYINERDKREIQKRAERLDLSLSDYMKLKALDRLKEDEFY